MKIKELIIEAEVIQPKTGAAQYVNDIASAIRSGAAGDISYKTATDVSGGRAPAGTEIAPWKKTNDGWVHSQTNVAANPTQAATLDKEWNKRSQLAARQAQAQKQQDQTAPQTQPTQQATTQQTQQPGNAPADQQAPAQKTPQQQSQMVNQIKLMDESPIIYQFGGKANLFTLNDKDQWVRYTPGSTKPQQPVDANTSTLLDKAAKRDGIDMARLQPGQTSAAGGGDVVTQTDATKVASVTTPAGNKADKWSDGHWTTPDEQGVDGFVVDSDVPKLDALLKQQSTKTHTGGRQKGGLSQTPNAVRKRASRAEMPAVIKSNRR